MSLIQEAKRLVKKNASVAQFVNDINFGFRHHQSFSKTSENEKKIIYEIYKNGFYVIPNFVSKEFCDKCIADIESIFVNHKDVVTERTDFRISGAE